MNKRAPKLAFTFPRWKLPRELRLVIPSWLGSTLVHLALIIALMWTFLEPERTPRGVLLESTTLERRDDAEDLQVLDDPIEIAPIDATQIAADVLDAQIETEIDVTSIDTEAAAAPMIELSAVSVDVLPLGDLLAETTGLTGSGLTGRGDAARRALVAERGGSAESEAAVMRALNWLALHQNLDGSWNFDHRHGNCQGRCSHPGALTNSTTGATGLALLPYLGAGHTHLQGKYAKNVEAGLYYLASQVQLGPDGGSLRQGGAMYDHGIATIALCEAYAMTQDEALRAPAQAALQFIVTSQDPRGGGWRYRPREPGDTSVVGWQLMALKSGHLAYLNVPPQTVAGVSHFLDTVAQNNGAAYGYVTPGNGPATSAVGLLCRMYLGWDRDHPALEAGVKRLSRMGPSPSNAYYNYYATQVLHHYEGPMWERWNEVMRQQLIDTQDKEGHAAGSWHLGADDPGALKGGRLYYTAMCCMILEVYYRYLPLYRKEVTLDRFE